MHKFLLKIFSNHGCLTAPTFVQELCYCHFNRVMLFDCVLFARVEDGMPCGSPCAYIAPAWWLRCVWLINVM